MQNYMSQDNLKYGYFHYTFKLKLFTYQLHMYEKNMYYRYKIRGNFVDAKLYVCQDNLKYGY